MALWPFWRQFLLVLFGHSAGFLMSKFTTPPTGDAGCSSRAIGLLVTFLPTIAALNRTFLGLFGARAEVRLMTSRAAIMDCMHVAAQWSGVVCPKVTFDM